MNVIEKVIKAVSACSVRPLPISILRLTDRNM